MCIFYSLGAPLDTSLFNILLKVYLTNDHQMSPSEFLEDMTGSGVQPNQVKTYYNFKITEIL